MAMDVRFLGSNPIFPQKSHHEPGGEQRYYDRHAPVSWRRPGAGLRRLAGLIAALDVRSLLQGDAPPADPMPARRPGM
jgi:hypothetical protein